MPSGFQPNQVLAADLNSDGNTDIVVASTNTVTGTGDVSVLLGNGDGTFQPSSSVATGLSDVNVAVADLNGDGKPDLVIGNIDATDVAVLLGNGDGSFQAPVNYPVGVSAQTVVTGDFNGDGRVDIILTGCSSVSGLSIVALAGGGDGGFSPSVTTALGGPACPVPLAAGDMDGDGKSDIVLSNFGFYTALSQGDGTFRLKFHAATGGIVVTALLTDDFNRDGKLDVVASNSDTNTASMLIGNGDGTFLIPPVLKYGISEFALVSVDFNGDGLSDLAVGGLVWLGKPGGIFGPPKRVQQPYTQTLVAADLNKDGKLDLIAAAFRRGSVAVSLGNGDGTFQKPLLSGGGRFPYSVVVADFNLDGNLDVATGNSDNSISVNLGSGDGTFYGGSRIALDNCCYIATADFNGDGKPDLVAAYVSLSHKANVLLGNGDGTFRKIDVDVGGVPAGVVTGDFDHDGKADMAVLLNPTVYGEFGNVAVLRGNGDGTFQPPRLFSSGASYGARIFVSDVDGDGNLDLIMTPGVGRYIAVMLGRGDGSFEALRLFATTDQPTDVAFGDFNHDGQPDMAVSQDGGPTVLLLNSSRGLSSDLDPSSVRP